VNDIFDRLIVFVQYLQPLWDDFCQYDIATFIEMAVRFCLLLLHCFFVHMVNNDFMKSRLFQRKFL